MGWEEEIVSMLQEAGDSVVRYDVEQFQTDEEKNRARNNIGISADVVNIADEDYQIIIN